MTELTQARLREVLAYDPETGVFTWIAGQCAGKVAGSKHKSGYRQIQIGPRIYKAHRLAWLYVHGRFPHADIDHLNGVRDDNRLDNLREATRSENLQNVTRARRHKSAGRLGAFWVEEKGKWLASTTLNGRSRFLGYYATESEAHEAYITAKLSVHPFFWPEKDEPIPYRITDKGRVMLRGVE